MGGPCVDQGDERGVAQGDFQQNGSAHSHARDCMKGEQGSLLVSRAVRDGVVGLVDLDAIHEEDALAKTVVASSERFIAVETKTEATALGDAGDDSRRELAEPLRRALSVVPALVGASEVLPGVLVAVARAAGHDGAVVQAVQPPSTPPGGRGSWLPRESPGDGGERRC